MNTTIYNRIVHFDLKGAPWKVPYLKDVIMAVKKWGATGILLEWEDSFPYTGRLTTIGSLGGSSRDGLYSSEEVTDLLQFIKDNMLEPIQLVQSLGHMEFVLKHEEFAHMREVSQLPAVLCPSRAGAADLVVAMLRQVLAKQPDASCIHIGADEAWHMNQCEECRARSAGDPHGAHGLFLRHVRGVVTALRRHHPALRVLLWDDMMRHVPEQALIGFEMRKYVIPVVWEYSPAPPPPPVAPLAPPAPPAGVSLPASLWDKYSRCFLQVWVASAYKGAAGGSKVLPPLDWYTGNQAAWQRTVRALDGRIIVGAVLLTGWSRYDHYATLCELLPVALPSLASCLRMWTCTAARESVISATLPAEEWPGMECAQTVADLYHCVQRCKEFLYGDLLQTFMNPWQVEHNYTSAMQMAPIRNTATLLCAELGAARGRAGGELRALTGPRSAAEWDHALAAHAARRLAAVAAVAEARAALPPAVVCLPTDTSES